MDTIEKELETNRVILDAGIQDQEKWEQNVEGHVRVSKTGINVWNFQSFK